MPNNISSLKNISIDNVTLNEKVILITGAGAGIGKAVALACAQQGATVILLGRTIKKLEKVYDDIIALEKQKPAIYPLDLLGANESDYENLCDILTEQYGRLDGLLHNASILGSLTPIAQYNIAQWQEVMHVNVTAPFAMTKSLLPALLKSNTARIIFTSSSVGRKGRAFWGAYSASKFATESLMQTLADEFEAQENIKINSINPGAVHTGMRLSAFPAEDKSLICRPSDIVEPYIYLLSEQCEKTGQMFNAQ